jgi:hypothetical protein
MALSKVKSKKQAKRLAARQADFERTPENKYSGHKFTKPGSNKK